jgi:hypothetical protein
MFTASQLVAHGFGDYVLQSHWMATEKTKRSFAALMHVLAYAIPFLYLRPSWPALFVIVSTHFVIDRWRLARYVVWAKNHLCPVRCMCREHQAHYATLGVFRGNNAWLDCQATGFPPAVPPFLAVWLLIIVDNLMHVTINALALTYL